jgi:hypothetical protein
MAENKDKKDDKKHSHHSGGEMHFGVEVLLFVLAVFILWVLAGGAKKPADQQKPFITPLTDQVNPGTTYGPTKTKN